MTINKQDYELRKIDYFFIGALVFIGMMICFDIFIQNRFTEDVINICMRLK